MAIRYPILFILLLFITLFLIIKKAKKKALHMSWKKVANTKYIKNTPYYKKMLSKYNLLIKIARGLCILGIFCSIVLTSRMTKIASSEEKKYSRDIFLCMDFSVSVDELNKSIIESLKETVKNLKNERFGISIFNTSSVVLVPLTDDYDYVLNVLDQLQEALNNYDDSTSENYFYNNRYIISGTTVGSDILGSSLIGDGLATCIYNFNDLETERTRIIIFSTDNDLRGKSTVSLQEAAAIAQQKNVVVYGIGTNNMVDRKGFKVAIEQTGGKFYSETSFSTVKDIVKNIEKTSKSLIKQKNNYKKIDIPQVPFYLLLISIFGYFYLCKKVKL